MKIGIDARMIDNSGIGTYIKLLLKHIKDFDKNEYLLFGDPAKLNHFGIKTIEAKFPIYSITEQLKLPGMIENSKVDIFHEPHYNIPYFYSGKMVVSIHDLIHILFPQFLSSRAAYYYAKFFLASACEKSQRIMTISENTKNDIIKHFRVEPSKIKVIYIGINPVFKPSLELAKEVREKIGKYILYVGALRPHKNVHTLVEAFNRLKKKNEISHKLVLVGNGKKDYIVKIQKMIAAYSIENSVLMPEVLNQEELRKYYCGADVFVFPSLYEGFGLPPLEAMASGCPVITSNSSSMPEVVGDAGIMTDAQDIDRLSNAIYKVISDEGLRKKMIEKGIARSKIFSYEKTVRETVNIYNDVLGK
ncbi:MAG: glycosyltransferase family 4 protein [Elusimicrobia bacterium]|nr:glycosyltransferase family 4 protein [Candidatus Liberimonas magnetica]